MRFFIPILLILILLLNNVSAIKISLSPAHINLSGKINTEICQKISLLSDKKVTFYGEDKWSLKNEKNNLAGYTLNSEDINIKVSYPKKVSAQTRQFDFCINSEKEGNFYGILYYKSATGAGGIGSLVKLNISNEAKRSNDLIVSLSSISLALILILFLLFIWKKKSRKIEQI